MAQYQEQEQPQLQLEPRPQGAGQHVDGGNSMQNLVIRLLLAASRTTEPVASELKDIAMSLSCAAMTAVDDSSDGGLTHEPSSSRNSAVPYLGMLTDGTSAPTHSRDASRGDIATSTAVVLGQESPHTGLRDASTPSYCQQYGLAPPSKPCPYPSYPGPRFDSQLTVGQRRFPAAGTKRPHPFDDSNATEHKRQQIGFPAGPPGRRPVCRECFSTGLAETCDHTARCDNCKTRSNVNCVYVACAQGMSCTAPRCHFMHPDQFNKNDRPVWQLKTAHLPGQPGGPVPGPRPLPPALKPKRKNEKWSGRRPWGAPRQMSWTIGGAFTTNRPSRPAMGAPTNALAPQKTFPPCQNDAAGPPPPPPVVNEPFTFPKIEPSVGNVAPGTAAPAISESEYPRGLLKYETDE
ncbi:hypothetical protein DOTSEDRAFT_32360 [Dothistroma septosporum NZE10]|uniref:Uncharacterized protein n=1 Tax=Dothistroma septosporum (strain NZE10 / CBS 128990) TaxID=675120 RepID=N1PYH5_DOTSN|nr:hypothetical protein DOTSEDRAFT_32360 [Dothistroma septosporum NZE10]